MTTLASALAAIRAFHGIAVADCPRLKGEAYMDTDGTGTLRLTALGGPVCNGVYRHASEKTARRTVTCGDGDKVRFVFETDQAGPAGTRVASLDGAECHFRFVFR